jgi:hypothetical protein
MTKRIITTLAIVAMLTIAASPVSANEVVRGNTFAIALTGLPDELYPGDPLPARLRILIYENGTRSRQPVTITTWTETPLGRAILSSQTRRLLPGQPLSTSAVLNYDSPLPPGSGSISTTVGVTVTYKNETLEARHTLILHSAPSPQ